MKSEEIVNCVFVFLRAFLNRFSLTYSSTSLGFEGELVVGVCRLCKRFYAKFLDIWFKAQLCQQCQSQKMSKRHPKLWRSYWIPRSLTTSATRRCNSKEPIAIFVLAQLSHIGLWNFGRPEGWWERHRLGTDSEVAPIGDEQRWTEWVQCLQLAPSVLLYRSNPASFRADGRLRFMLVAVLQRWHCSMITCCDTRSIPLVVVSY